MDSDSRKFIVATVFDVVAKEHCPPFLAPNMGILWRNVDALMKQATSASSSDFVVCVIGEFYSGVLRPLLPSDVMYYSVDRAPVSYDQVVSLLEVK